MSKKKNLLAKAKEQLRDRREALILELKKLYECREKDGGSEVNPRIDACIEEISTIDKDLSRKDKKSSNIQWLNPEYKATKRGTGARSANIVDHEEYDRFQDRKFYFDSGPQSLWLKPGILVKTKTRSIPGIVLEIKNSYATVLFGGSEVNIRKLALRPADWED